MILKVQTNQQYDDLNLKIYDNSNQDKNNNNNSNENNNDANQSQIQKITNTIKDTIFGTFLGGSDNNKNNNINNKNINNIEQGINNRNQQLGPQQMSLLQLARTQYDLNGISDNQLQDAINKSNGNIEQAIVLLMS